MNNDFVKMEQKVCPVCGITHEYNTGILLSKDLNPIENAVTGFGLCEEHEKMREEYIALIVLPNDYSGKLTVQDTFPHRTGNIIHLKRDKAAEIFNNPKMEDPEQQTLIFIDEDLFNQFKDNTGK